MLHTVAWALGCMHTRLKARDTKFKATHLHMLNILQLTGYSENRGKVVY